MRDFKIRVGFTLIELLVVIAVVGILIAILVPAVQRVRDSANRTTCQNNLHQLCVALHSYVDVKRQFPPAYKANGFEPGWGWGALILPHLEQRTLYDNAGVERVPFGGGIQPAPPNQYTQAKLTVFRCPADLGPDLNPERANHAMANYRAIAGPTTTPWVVVNQDMGGVFFQNSRIKPRQILDGTSNTMIVGECMFDAITGKRAALWAGMRGAIDNMLPISDVMWWLDEDSSVINGPAPQAFSSRHPGGAHFGFGDGSVRFVLQGGDTNIIRFLAGRNDGVNVTLP